MATNWKAKAARLGARQARNRTDRELMLRAIALSQNYGVAYNNRGKAYRAMGDLTRAIADFDEAARLEPDNPNFAAYGL